jgi:hypothetical protein
LPLACPNSAAAKRHCHQTDNNRSQEHQGCDIFFRNIVLLRMLAGQWSLDCFAARRLQAKESKFMPYRHTHLPSGSNQMCRNTPAAMKAQQASKIRNIAHALATDGIVRLDHQAQALGLSRSTAWTILRASHKSTGISGTIIARMLASPTLPASARAAIIEYVEEKAAGIYGHSKAQRRRFIAALAGKLGRHRYFAHSVPLQPELSFESSKPEETQNALASVLEGEHWSRS